jgi:hypothetical protein
VWSAEHHHNFSPVVKLHHRPPGVVARRNHSKDSGEDICTANPYPQFRVASFNLSMGVWSAGLSSLLRGRHHGQRGAVAVLGGKKTLAPLICKGAVTIRSGLWPVGPFDPRRWFMILGMGPTRVVGGFQTTDPRSCDHNSLPFRFK